VISQTELQDEPENVASLILKVDLRTMAHCIEDKFGDLLQTPPPGIYCFRQVEPILVPGHKYYIARRKSELPAADFDRYVAQHQLKYTNDVDQFLIEVPNWLEDWASVQDALYTETGVMLLSAPMMKDKTRLVSDKPILPYRGMRLAQLLYDRAIDSRITWPHMHVDHMYLIQEQLTAGAYDDEDLDILLDPFHLLAEEHTFEFTNRHSYHLFSSKLSASTLTLTRYQDYRVLAWHRDQREKHQAEQERKRCC
jgi:hypothetical protein